MDSTTQTIPMSKWMRNSTVKFYPRNPDAMSIPSYVSLSSDHVVKIMAAGYEIVCRDTFFITCRARQILSGNLSKKVFSEDEIFKAEKSINGQMEKLHEYFDTRINQGEKKLELEGFTVDEMQRIVVNYETKPVTNAVTQYLDLLSKADLYITILHYLWLTSNLSDNSDEAMRVKLNTEREIREHLFSVTRFTSKHYNEVRRICNGVLEQRRVEREQQSERDRQRHQEKEAEMAKAKSEKPRKNKAKKKPQATSGAEATLVIAQKELSSLSKVSSPVAIPA